MDNNTADSRTGDMRSSDSPKSVELNSEEFKIIQAQITNLTQQLSVAQTVSTKEKARAEDLKAMAERLQADFDNHRKRTAEMSKKLKEDGQAEVIEKIIPLTDTLRQAITLVKDEKTQEGLRLVLRQFMHTLEGLEVTEIPALGEMFDPNLHNA
ncbi:MAG: nucleotide exchange factor GrpE, partial [Firmicutes bacterium]|nr:nucleotide exchange factor GrpE [Bacillota bacterium]